MTKPPDSATGIRAAVADPRWILRVDDVAALAAVHDLDRGKGHARAVGSRTALTGVVPGDRRPRGERIVDTLQGGRECREVS